MVYLICEEYTIRMPVLISQAYNDDDSSCLTQNLPSLSPTSCEYHNGAVCQTVFIGQHAEKMKTNTAGLLFVVNVCLFMLT